MVVGRVTSRHPVDSSRIVVMPCRGDFTQRAVNITVSLTLIMSKISSTCLFKCVNCLNGL